MPQLSKVQDLRQGVAGAGAGGGGGGALGGCTVLPRSITRDKAIKTKKLLFLCFLILLPNISANLKFIWAKSCAEHVYKEGRSRGGQSWDGGWGW